MRRWALAFLLLELIVVVGSPAVAPESRAAVRHVVVVADSMPALTASTALLAFGVSFVELACTTGFPVLWTKIVAARDVNPTIFALLLALYMLVYQLDEVVIFGSAVVTMHATKLQQRQGRVD
jgi:hypothetical protein